MGENVALEFIEKHKSIMVVGGKGIGKSCLVLVITKTLLDNDHVVLYEFGDIVVSLVPSKDALDRLAKSEIVRHMFQSSSYEMVNEVGVFLLQGDRSFSNDLALLSDVVHVVDVGEDGAAVRTGHRQIIISSPNTEKLNWFEEV